MLFAIASHVTKIEDKEYDGIGNVLLEIAPQVTDRYLFVRHSMDGKLHSQVREYEKGVIIRKKSLFVPRRPSPIRYIFEVLASVFYFTFIKKVDIYIGIDPLNALAGVLLKKIRRIDQSIFYTADYSIRRFNNKYLDSSYHRIDAYCVKKADEVWSVSSKIVEIRKKMGLPDNKNFFVPNVPPVQYETLRNNSHDRFNLIMYGIIDKQLDYEGAIGAVAKLENEYPKISLTIIGNGPEEENLKKYASNLNVEDRINFLGRQSLGSTLEYASRAGIGLALYTGVWGFNQFGDSTKVREYFNFGLPVISTDTHSTVGEIISNSAGIIVSRKIEEYADAIKTILDNYDYYSKNSLSVGKIYAGVHQKMLDRISKD